MVEENDLSHYAKKNVLITGASGYIGSLLVNELIKLKANVTAVSRKNVSKEQVSFVKTLDYIDFLDNMELSTFDIVFYLNAQTSPTQADENPLSDFQSNLSPLLCMLEKLKNTSTRPALIFPSTVAVYGSGDNETIFSETHPTLPTTMYEQHKVVAESYLKYYCNRYSLSSSVLRLSNVYGPSNADSPQGRGILNLMIKKTVAGTPLEIYGNERFLRDYIFIADVIKAFLRSGVYSKGFNVFNICFGESFYLDDVFKQVIDHHNLLQKSNLKLTHNHDVPLSPTEKRNFRGTRDKASRLFKWAPSTNIKRGIETTYAHYRDHQ